jgi:hypothetical protein
MPDCGEGISLFSFLFLSIERPRAGSGVLAVGLYI